MLENLDPEGGTPLIRTDFSDDAAWQRIVAAATAETDVDGEESEDGYVPYIDTVEDRSFDGATAESLTARANGEVNGYLLLADARSMREASGGELTLVWLDLSVLPEDADEFGWVYGRAFRCTTRTLGSIEANLSLANMDFEDYADSVDPDGVFRGFSS